MSVPSPTRNSKVDNVKAMLIFLVVFGHMIETYIGNNHVLRSLWNLIYFIHMPMFALISGMFSKAELNSKTSTSLIRQVAIPLLAFEIIYELVEYALQGQLSVYASLFAPYWMLWYLLSLLCWRMLLPIFSRLQFPVWIALLLAILASYSEHAGYFLSSSRTLVFFPYFVLGWQLGGDALKQPVPTVQKLIYGLLLLLGAGAIYQLPHDFDYRWLYGSYSLHRLEMANWHGSLYQLLQYLVSLTIGWSAIKLFAEKDWKLAQIGERSLYVLVWHGMALIGMQVSGALPWMFRQDAWLAFILSVASSVLIVYLCTHDWCLRLTQKLLLQPLNWLLTRQEIAKPAALSNSWSGELKNNKEGM